MTLINYRFIQETGCFGCSGYDTGCSEYESTHCRSVRKLSLEQIKLAQDYSQQKLYIVRDEMLEMRVVEMRE
jgi:hypothetical protein